MARATQNCHIIVNSATRPSGLRKRDQLLREQGGPNEHDAVKDRRAFAASASEFLSFADVLAPAFVKWLYFELLPSIVSGPEKVVFEYAEGLVIRIGAKAVKVTGSALRGLADRLGVPTKKWFGWIKRTDKEIGDDLVRLADDKDAMGVALKKANQAETTDAAKNLLFSRQMEGRAAQIADSKLVSSLVRRGYKFFQDSETQRLLDYFKANASTDLAKRISLRPNARHVEVLEEYLHNVMNRKGMYKGLSNAEQEILTKEWMIRHKELLKITEEDAAWLRRSADMYKK